MDAKSQLKVVRAGFTIIRKDDSRSPRIKYKDARQTEWATLRKFDTKAARDREFNKLIALNLIIND
jgi:hypothetical protein